MPIKLKQNFLKNINKKQARVYVDLSIYQEEPEEQLGNRSITTSTVTKNFSFKDRAMTDRDFVENPNILETQDYVKVKNNPTLLADKFSETEDSIYALDADLPDLTKNTSKQNPSLKKVANIIKPTGSKYAR